MRFKKKEKINQDLDTTLREAKIQIRIRELKKSESDPELQP